MYSFLPIPLIFDHLQGKEIAFCGESPFNNFFEVNKDNLEYNAAFEVQKGVVLAKIRRTNRAISFTQKYKNGMIVFLPTMASDIAVETQKGQRAAKTFLKSIYDLDNQLYLEKEVNALPDWTENFHILDEVNAIEAKQQAEQKIEKLKRTLESKQKS